MSRPVFAGSGSTHLLALASAALAACGPTPPGAVGSVGTSASGLVSDIDYRCVVVAGADDFPGGVASATIDAGGRIAFLGTGPGPYEHAIYLAASSASGVAPARERLIGIDLGAFEAGGLASVESPVLGMSGRVFFRGTHVGPGGTDQELGIYAIEPGADPVLVLREQYGWPRMTLTSPFALAGPDDSVVSFGAREESDGTRLAGVFRGVELAIPNPISTSALIAGAPAASRSSPQLAAVLPDPQGWRLYSQGTGATVAGPLAVGGFAPSVAGTSLVAFVDPELGLHAGGLVYQPAGPLDPTPRAGLALLDDGSVFFVGGSLEGVGARSELYHLDTRGGVARVRCVGLPALEPFDELELSGRATTPDGRLTFIAASATGHRWVLRADPIPTGANNGGNTCSPGVGCTSTTPPPSPKRRRDSGCGEDGTGCGSNSATGVPPPPWAVALLVVLTRRRLHRRAR